MLTRFSRKAAGLLWLSLPTTSKAISQGRGFIVRHDVASEGYQITAFVKNACNGKFFFHLGR